MNITVFASGSHIFSNCEYIKGYAFRNHALREKSAHFAKFHHIVTANFAVLGDSYAHFANINDCFECLSPDMYKVA